MRRTPSIIVAMALLGAVVALASYSAEKDEPDIGTGGALPFHFGFNDLWGRPGLVDDLGRVADTGADAIRVTVGWNEIEPEPGSYDWSRYDPIYEEALANGLRPILVPLGSPCWASRLPGCGSNGVFQRTGPPARSRIKAWQRFLAELVNHYPEALAIELWNEPNLEGFFAGGADPQMYALMARTGAAAVKSADPGMTVISAGLAPIQRTEGGDIRPAAFLASVYRQGGLNRVDGIGVHVYSGRRVDQDYLGGIASQLAEARTVMADNGDAELPIWVTETGVSTTAGTGFDVDAQASFLDKDFALLAATEGVEAMIAHRWRNLDGPSTDRETGFGVVSADGEAKPALEQLSATVGEGG